MRMEWQLEDILCEMIDGVAQRRGERVTVRDGESEICNEVANAFAGIANVLFVARHQLRQSHQYAQDTTYITYSRLPSSRRTSVRP